MSAQESQNAGAVLMVRPARFGFNPETAATNAFQHRGAGEAGAHAAALSEFDGLAEGLARAGVDVIVADDTPLPYKPDAIFPNNWVSFHADGSVVLYPMLAENRRLERREEVLEQIAARGAYRISRTVDLSRHERSAKYLEGTGSLVLDRVARVAYAALSPRTDLDVLGDFAQQLDYELASFEARDATGLAIYHSNVLMAVGAGFAVVCAATIANPVHRDAVIARLRVGGHEIIEISVEQMQQFAGNVLALTSAGGDLVAMSGTAWRAFDPVQRRALEKHGAIVAVEIPTIERLGGGGVRCMLAEIHLPKRLS